MYTAPAQLLEYSTWLALLARLPAAAWSGIERRAARFAKRSFELGSAKADAARRPWTKRVLSNMIGVEVENGECRRGEETR